MVEFWYNMRTGAVEQGAQSLTSELVGPFETRAEAEHALDKLAENSRKWAAEEAADDK